ncbi:hypothetical protein MAPG_11797 [Magnaporthiopsis poae ATCC 64411]|uniref:Uncharacterized protein n=1 Tax=Magnaporthiopsis poae (strain ATCC 64411 / 73-15) TaxID=644358 RepID=A0A0C4EG74_MAGP6|nr:hypothetical protein MAPG_11797 [Magnaporthiopsis poae ATCC 64411]
MPVSLLSRPLDTSALLLGSISHGYIFSTLVLSRRACPSIPRVSSAGSSVPWTSHPRPQSPCLAEHHERDKNTATRTFNIVAMEGEGLREDVFPAPHKIATGTVGGISTEASSMTFSDKIMVMLSQEGRLAQWIQVQLSAPSAAMVEMALPRTNIGSLPPAHLTATTLLGAGNDDRETIGHLYAAQIANFMSLKNPDEKRTLILGLGLRKAEADRETFFDVLELVQKVL